MVSRQIAVMVALIVMAQLASAYDDFSSYNVVEVSVQESSSAVAVPEFSGSIKVDYIEANLSLFPKEADGQVIAKREVRVTPSSPYTIQGEQLLINWKDPTQETVRFEIDSKISILNYLYRVPSKIPFPYGSYYEGGPFGKGVTDYTKETKTIVLSDKIREKSAEIVEGETDYYNAVFRVAQWVHESINYSLDTMTAEAVQDSEWVLENRYGVCDEISVLFMALLRASNIPARFVAGQAYSNKDESFGNHGWAEVYFPGVGWIPFDVTFMQFGWVDPSHIKLDTEMDPSEPSISYSWKASETKVKVNPLMIQASIDAVSGAPGMLASMEIVPLRDSVSNGSFVPVKVIVKNLQEFYLPLAVTITKAPGLVEKNSMPALLAPYEERVMFWTAKLPAEAQKGYRYTTVIEAKSQFSAPVTANISFAEDNEFYSSEWASDVLKRLSPHDVKSFLPEIEFSCSADKPYYYRYETAKVLCTIRNKGNMNFKPIKLCFEEKCKDADILIGETKDVSWELPIDGINSSDFVATAESMHMMKYAYPDMRIIEEPKIVISELQPKVIPYGTDAELSFIAISDEEANNITFDVRNLGFSSLSRLQKQREIVMPFNSKKFRDGIVQMEMTYFDEAGKEYKDTYKEMISVTDIPWHIRLVMWIEGLMPFVKF